MQITCRHCQHTVEFAGQRPANCRHCGRLLDDRASDPTIDYLPPREPHDTATAPQRAAEGQAMATAAVGERVGGYRLVQPIGQGGMGMVWEAEQVGTGRRVALKLLSPRLRPTAENVDRFLREGKLAASLSHPRSTFVFDAGQQDGQPYIAMELMPGRTLKDVLDEEGPLPVERAVDHILDVIDGLEAAHALGVIHRDVKPSNCFLDSDGRVKVGDFGLSKSLVSDAELTQTGTFLGTPQFAAPEQVKGGVVDQRTDVYAVGATLFCLLAGRAPFTGDAAAVIAQIVSEAAPPVSSIRPEVRQSLSSIVARTLEKDPKRRFHDLAGLRRALIPFATGGVSMADIGRRFAAYMLDSLVIQAGTFSVMFSVGMTMSLRAAAAGSQESASYYSTTFNAWMQVTSAAAQVLYFGLTEGSWGRGLGKRLMGLRVIGPEGDRPAYGRSFLRSWFVPGAFGLLILSPLLSLASPSTSASSASFLSPRTAGMALLPTVFTLLCLTTMRARNGYRGLHELVSGTRVVRLRKSIAGRKRPLPILLPVATQDATNRFGPFDPVGELGRSGQLAVIQARDEVLGRAVCIHIGPRTSGIPDKRRTVARPTRPHWLQGGELADQRWDAFEAVVGSPLVEVARQAGGAPWRESRFWLLDLCEELLAATSDDTLPEQLSLDQLWIARGGRLKLLEAPVRGAAAPAGDAPVYRGTVAERAVNLLREAVRLCTREDILPMHVRQFAAELASRPESDQTLAWAADQLREAARQPTALAWDDRLGVLAVSMGTELSIYMLVAFILPWLFITQLQWPLHKFAALLPLALLAPGLLGYSFHGGPAFWLTHIDVLRADGRRANRWACAWRSVVAWTPMLVLYLFLGLLMAKMAPSIGAAGSQPAPAFQFKPDDPETWILLGGLCCSELLGLLFFVGAVYAVVRPQRGLQDWLSGTWLAPQ